MDSVVIELNDGNDNIKIVRRTVLRHIGSWTPASRSVETDALILSRHKKGHRQSR